MTFAEYLRVLRKRWLTVLSLTILGVLIAGSVTVLMPRVYTASATNFVSINDANAQRSALSQSSQFALANVTSFTGLVSSPSVLQPVIEDLGLKLTPAQLSKQVNASNPAGTVLIVVEARSSSGAQARAIANEASRQLGLAAEKLSAPKDGGASQVTVTEAKPASEPLAPSSPRATLNIALGLLVGLFLGAAAAVLRDRFDVSIKSVEDLQAVGGIAPLGAVPYESAAATRPLLALDSGSGTVESFRSIRTNLRFVDVDNPPRQVVITSAVGGEGKTVTACSLALTLAQGARKVCLVEGDLRRPKACTYLGLNGAIGLTDVVAGQYVLDDVLVPWNRGQITVLPAGTPPPDPSQLLGSRAVHDILVRLRERFDFVVIDSPPVLPVTDAAVLGALSDGAVVVIRQGSTHRETVAQALEHLHNSHTHVVGTVLTGVKSRRDDSSYTYQPSETLADVTGDTSLEAAEAAARLRSTTRLSSASDEFVVVQPGSASESDLHDAASAPGSPHQ